MEEEKAFRARLALNAANRQDRGPRRKTAAASCETTPHEAGDVVTDRGEGESVDRQVQQQRSQQTAVEEAGEGIIKGKLFLDMCHYISNMYN